MTTYAIQIPGETVLFPFRAAFFMARNVRPDGSLVVFGPFSMN